MKFPSRVTIERFCNNFPVGCTVELLEMNDDFAPPIGTLGEVLGADDLGSIMVRWRSGSRLSVAYPEDSCRRIGGMDDRDDFIMTGEE